MAGFQAKVTPRVLGYIPQRNQQPRYLASSSSFTLPGSNSLPKAYKAKRKNHRCPEGNRKVQPMPTSCDSKERGWGPAQASPVGEQATAPVGSEGLNSSSPLGAHNVEN